jgi:PHD/YefM family antitoxin component YafN of YafNO toxin-antitoxin module
MKKVNALAVRQSLGKVLDTLRKTGEPILVEKNRRSAAVLITLEDYQRRFADRDADEKRLALVARLRQMRFDLPAGRSSLELVREVRGTRSRRDP